MMGWEHGQNAQVHKIKISTLYTETQCNTGSKNWCLVSVTSAHDTSIWNTALCFCFPRMPRNYLYNKKNVQHVIFLVNDQRDAQTLFYVFISVYNALHVSSTSCSSLAETNCINTTSGNSHSMLVAEMCAGWKKKRICASRWSFTKNHYMMHGQQNVKKHVICFFNRPTPPSKIQTLLDTFRKLSQVCVLSASFAISILGLKIH